MSFCTNCGAQLPDNSKFCGYCGQAVKPSKSAPVPAPENKPTYTSTSSVSGSSYGASSYSAPASTVRSTPTVPHYNTGGLMVWSILSLLFGALIFGILALSNTTQINKCATVEEQQKKIKAARTWCIVSTIIGALVIIGQAAQLS